MNLLWENTAQIPKFERLDSNINTDVLIIGGGMAGILCAVALKNAGIDYVLVEAETLCDGITKNTTAKITSQHGLIYDKLIKSKGKDNAKLYLEANQKALYKYREICENIDCDFEQKDSYVYSVSNRKKIESEVTALENLGVKAHFCDNLPLPLSVAGAIRFKNQAQFNPVKFISGVAKDLNVYEHTRVKELIGTTAITGHGRINAKKIIVATHFPFINKHGSYFVKMYQHRSYVLALENAPLYDGMYVDESLYGLSFRNYGNLLLLGGGSHRTGKKGGNWQELREFAKKHYPNAKEKFFWATQDCMTLDGIPYIGRYSANTENLYVATGFNKWGMTSSMVSAMILCDMVQGKSNPYENLFSPSRSILYPQLCINAFESAVNLLTPAKKRCPHLGCALKWNSVEHTWDCPCHGSRFDRKGQLIDNPATGDLKN